MKNLLLLLLCSCALSSAQSQVGKGTTLIGGNLGVSRLTTESENTTNANKTYREYIGFSPMIGRAIKENLVVGVMANYIVANATELTNNEKSYGGGVFVRKYLPIGGRFMAFGQTALNYLHGSRRSYYTTFPTSLRTSKYNSITAGLNPGISFAAGKRFHVELALGNIIELGYTNEKHTYDSRPGVEDVQRNYFLQSSLNLSSLFSTALGFRFLL